MFQINSISRCLVSSSFFLVFFSLSLSLVNGELSRLQQQQQQYRAKRDVIPVGNATFITDSLQIQLGKPIAITCRIHLNPNPLNYLVTYYVNSTSVGQYRVYGNKATQFEMIPQSFLAIKQGPLRQYPTFDAVIIPQTATAAGEWKCATRVGSATSGAANKRYEYYSHPWRATLRSSSSSTPASSIPQAKVQFVHSSRFKIGKSNTVQCKISLSPNPNNYLVIFTINGTDIGHYRVLNNQGNTFERIVNNFEDIAQGNDNRYPVFSVVITPRSNSARGVWGCKVRVADSVDPAHKWYDYSSKTWYTNGAGNSRRLNWSLSSVWCWTMSALVMAMMMKSMSSMK